MLERSPCATKCSVVLFWSVSFPAISNSICQLSVKHYIIMVFIIESNLSIKLKTLISGHMFLWKLFFVMIWRIQYWILSKHFRNFLHETPRVHIASQFLWCRLVVWIFLLTYISIRTTVQTVLVWIIPSPFYHKFGLLVYEDVQYCKRLPSLEGDCCLYLQEGTHLII